MRFSRYLSLSLAFVATILLLANMGCSHALYLGTATDVSRPHHVSEYSVALRAVSGSVDTEELETMLQFRHGLKRRDFSMGLQWHYIMGRSSSPFYFISPTLLLLAGVYDGEEEYAITPGIGFGTAFASEIDHRQSRHIYIRADISQAIILVGNWAPPQFMLSVGFRWIDGSLR